jgi:murein DD-endopeptidase MepM/ murein hydrolase activator NlpD
MRVLLCIGVLVLISSCGVQYRFASKQEYDNDTSYVYSLPYPEGTSHLLLQGYNSQLSHKKRLGLDFKMKKGSLVTAARSGVVVRVDEKFTRGGISYIELCKDNQGVFRDVDGSQAYYGHLQYQGVLVNTGDTVKQGSVIAKSGSTGYSATPHLHFTVWGPTPKGRSQLPTRFKTKKGAVYLKPGKWYRAF